MSELDNKSAGPLYILQRIPGIIYEGPVENLKDTSLRPVEEMWKNMTVFNQNLKMFKEPTATDSDFFL